MPPRYQRRRELLVLKPHKTVFGMNPLRDHAPASFAPVDSLMCRGGVWHAAAHITWPDGAALYGRFCVEMPQDSGVAQ